jgi:starch phosphorylase
MSDIRNFTQYDLEMTTEAVKRSIANHLEYTQGKDEYSVTPMDLYLSAARAVRDRMFDRRSRTKRRYFVEEKKWVYYLSLEFLTGRLLADGALNLDLDQQLGEALGQLGASLEDAQELEWDPGLGNGGLGRLAACFMDSCATLDIPAMGCGIRYEYGIFRQVLVDGAQQERADGWLRYGWPWEVPRVELLYPVQFYGNVEQSVDADGQYHFAWVNTQDVMAMAYDIPVPGHRNDVVNTLRLWSAKATREFDVGRFNEGDYIHAIEAKTETENLSRVLYPADHIEAGRELRLKQEYFLVCATLQDAIRRHLVHYEHVDNLAEQAVFQLNDTHPAIAIPELMRLLMDVYGMGWTRSWAIVSRCFAYTNHTVLPEALETWPVSLIQRVLPRHMQIINEIDDRLRERVRKAMPNDPGAVQRVSIVTDGAWPTVRMAHLAVAGSYSVNGVSALHSRIVVQRVFPDFARLDPDKFQNKTNGITPRRWLRKANPRLAGLITEAIGDGWVTDLAQLERLRPLAEDREFQVRWLAAKRANKERLATFVNNECADFQRVGAVDVESLYDVQIKRMHEYKRQLLNVLHIVSRYLRYQEGIPPEAVPRTFLFAGKAAPSYTMAKRVIQLITHVARVVNGDPAVNAWLRVAFLPNYGVSLAERIVPAADISEQISTAGTEASGTGNMKLSLNGALTVGTLDGANIEIREAVGEENFFTFGLRDEEVQARRAAGYDPKAVAQADAQIKATLDAIGSGLFSPAQPDLFTPILRSLLEEGDRYLVLADFADYLRAHREIDALYRQPAEWARKSILNVAGMGPFSSDTTIRAYARDIWGIAPGRPAGERME